VSALADLLDQAAARLDGIVRRAAADQVEYVRGSAAFATVSGQTVEFRLHRAIAAAAAGTPDVTGSPRGPDWVAFTPPELDRFASDRAVAWFESAWRRAGG
jgi:hypothetical protein